jgi:hypothetical protein
MVCQIAAFADYAIAVGKSWHIANFLICNFADLRVFTCLLCSLAFLLVVYGLAHHRSRWLWSSIL